MLLDEPLRALKVRRVRRAGVIHGKQDARLFKYFARSGDPEAKGLLRAEMGADDFLRLARR